MGLAARRGVPSSFPNQHPPAEQQEKAGGQERQIRGQVIGRVFINVMDAQHFVIDQAFDQVEQAPAGGQRAGSAV
jgi:hypothetical protein